jgi:hypothetical protein
LRAKTGRADANRVKHHRDTDPVRRTARELMAVEVDGSGPRFEIRAPKPLFPLPVFVGPRLATAYAIAPDGKRILANAASDVAEPRIVLYRRFMLRIAESLAERDGALAMVTGESVGQVSSQTLANLDTINRAATLPVLRPLVGSDKSEIISLAQRVGTYAISIEPDEDCCSFLMPRQPATWTRPEAIEAIERGLDVKGLVEATLSRVELERIEPIS